MGISSNQARFLALTSRQVDLEHRIQQICQRRLRLSSELENTATSYNNKISNRQLFAMNTANSGISDLSISSIQSLKDANGNNYALVYKDSVMGYTETITFVSGSVGLRALKNGFVDEDITPEEVGLKAPTSQRAMLDAALRSGVISLARLSDEYTQSSTSVGNEIDSTTKNMELLDWRTVPSLADELFASDDVDAENKYDKTIAEINAQDKKLQLEQTSIEVEYKAITSEKESVKKVLDTNAQASFKYFS